MDDRVKRTNEYHLSHRISIKFAHAMTDRQQDALSLIWHLYGYLLHSAPILIAICQGRTLCVQAHCVQYAHWHTLTPRSIVRTLQISRASSRAARSGISMCCCCCCFLSIFSQSIADSFTPVSLSSLCNLIQKSI